MRRVVAVTVAALSVVLASLVSMASPADETSLTMDVPLEGTYDLRDGLSARVSDVSIALVPAEDPAAQASLRYLVVNVELTRTKFSPASYGARLHSGRRTFEAFSVNYLPEVGFMVTATSYFLMEKDDIPGARLDLTADTRFLTGGFHWVYSMDLGLTEARVAELDARAEAVDTLPSTRQEAVR